MSEAKKTYLFLAVCVAVIVGGFLIFRGKKPPSVEIEDRMTAIQAAVENWHAAKGSPPDTLEELGLPEEEIQDIVKKPFLYSVSEDGTTVTLMTLGADGKPGGKMFNADREIVFSLDTEKE